jgi:hypothetical protein
VSDTATSPSSLIAGLHALERQLKEAGDPMDCEISIGRGDWGGQHVLLTLSRGSAVCIARLLVDLARKNVRGAHFDIDKASIAVDATDQVCFALNASGE